MAGSGGRGEEEEIAEETKSTKGESGAGKNRTDENETKFRLLRATGESDCTESEVLWDSRLARTSPATEGLKL